ncbi:DNA glycosylase AlkZ-like family protein [Corynebacterium sp. 335C]
MPDRSLGRRRLAAQGLLDAPWATPADAVRAFGVMQGQDLGSVVASAALRSTGRVADVLAAMDSGELVRGYPMRGTVFLAAAEDLRWVTELCASGSRAARRRREERHPDFHPERAARIRGDVLDRAAAPGGVSRSGYREVLRDHGIEGRGSTAYWLLHDMLVDGDLVYGPWNGVDQNLVPGAGALGPGLEGRYDGNRPAAVSDLLARYLRTRGPATLDDFAWWSKLPRAEIREAAALLPDDVVRAPEPGERGRAAGASGALRASGADGLWQAADLEDRAAELDRAARGGLLLPAFDEYVLGYRDRLFAMDAATHDHVVPGNRGIFRKTVVVDAVVRGSWTRTGAPGRRRLDVEASAVVPKAAWPRLRRRFAEFPFLVD